MDTGVNCYFAVIQYGPNHVSSEQPHDSFFIREQWYYNNAHQEVVTCIHSVKIEAKFWQNPLDSNLGQQVLFRSLVLCSVN